MTKHVLNIMDWSSTSAKADNGTEALSTSYGVCFVTLVLVRFFSPSSTNYLHQF